MPSCNRDKSAVPANSYKSTARSVTDHLIRVCRMILFSSPFLTISYYKYKTSFHTTYLHHLLLLEMGEERFNLPPGFRFHPTDEELVVHFLYRKVALLPCHPDIIPDVDLDRYDPWELNGQIYAPFSQTLLYIKKNKNGVLILSYQFSFMGVGKALKGDNQLYFFSHTTQERVSPNGYWKHLGVDDPITSASQTVGFKKLLVFYIGEASVGIKTNWVMHEYHLLDGATSSRSSRRRGKPKTVSWSVIVVAYI